MDSPKSFSKFGVPQKKYYFCRKYIETHIFKSNQTKKKETIMCTINMTFEVPETRHIDIERLKQKVNAYVMHLISMPRLEKQSNDMQNTNWRTWVIEPELLDMVKGTSKAKFSDNDPYYKEAITQAMEERYENLS